MTKDDAKFKALIGQLQDLEAQRDEIQKRIDEICQMIEALLSDEQTIGPFVKLPSYQQLAKEWMRRHGY